MDRRSYTWQFTGDPLNKYRRRKNMKAKYILFPVLLVGLIALAACSARENETTDPRTDSVVEEHSQEKNEMITQDEETVDFAYQTYDQTPSVIDPHETAYTPNPDPKRISLWKNEGENMGIYTETEYDQIFVIPTKSSYSISQDAVLSCKVVNRNAGHGFQMFEGVYLDRYIDGQWIRQCVSDDLAAQDVLAWLFVGTENAPERVMYTSRGIKLSEIAPAVTPGRYRFVVFTPVSTHYGEFELTE